MRTTLRTTWSSCLTWSSHDLVWTTKSNYHSLADLLRVFLSHSRVLLLLMRQSSTQQHRKDEDENVRGGSLSSFFILWHFPPHQHTRSICWSQGYCVLLRWMGCGSLREKFAELEKWRDVVGKCQEENRTGIREKVEWKLFLLFAHTKFSVKWTESSFIVDRRSSPLATLFFSQLNWEGDTDKLRIEESEAWNENKVYCECEYF